MDIYLIRHTKTDTEPGLCYGQTDVALANSFATEVKALRNKLPELNHAKVFSSPLMRCVQLAQEFAVTVNTDDRLLEVNFGDWENSRFDSIDRHVMQQWTENFVNQPPPHGESFVDLCQRTTSFWQHLLTIDSEQVVVVTHAGVIRALLVHILEIPLANAFQFQIDLGSVHKFQYLNDYIYVKGINL